MSEETNIVKSTCQELGLTYKELGEAIGYGEGAIKNSASSNKISEPMIKAIELLLKIKEQEEELKTLDNLKTILRSLTK